jgi:peptide/nickel transport system permease protein
MPHGRCPPGMTALLARRVLETVLALLVMSLVVFCLSRALGDPVALMVGDFATEQDRNAMRAELGLDRPVTEQYFSFLGHAARGDLGRSIAGDRQPVMHIIPSRLVASLQLAGVALLLSLSVGVPLGVAAAVRRGTWIDSAARMFALVGQSVPVFWIGIVLIFVFSVQLRWLPTSGYGGASHFVLPATTMALFTVAAITRLTRVGMLEALESDYVRLARMKGLRERSVVWKHGLANSIVPVVTYLGAFFATMITGAVVVETIFGWPGIGRLAYEAILNRDFPLMQAVVLVMTALFMGLNLLADVLHILIDPRVRRQ